MSLRGEHTEAGESVSVTVGKGCLRGGGMEEGAGPA